LVQHVEEGYVTEVERLEEGFKLAQGYDAPPVDVDDLADLLATLVTLQPLQKLLLG
jgi:hypothetical protein